MLYVRDKVAKLGNVILGGEVTSVEITEAGSVYVAQDEKGRYKKSQPVGYENGKVNIDILLEDMSGYSTLAQLRDMQNLFKANGQDNTWNVNSSGNVNNNNAVNALRCAPDCVVLRTYKLSHRDGVRPI